VYFGIVLELITDASLTFHGLWLRDCTLWVQWYCSFHTDLCESHVHSLLYLGPES